MPIKKNSQVHGFDILDVVELEELKARGIWARHESGAEVFHVLNDDSENLFAFAFVTPPGDSTGAAHILEHSVLCGSERYPLKDAFLILAQGSLQTFLNAWTFPDKTVYPASSVNKKDYFNLMSVYADAVFRPLLSEWTFMQEGWRLAPGKKGPGGTGLEYTGVVYNEMKGAYSSMDAYAGLWSVKAVMPGTPYAFESGGDPECIPGLSWEDLRAFHRSRYVPANCRIFLAGNVPTEEQLAFLDSQCLAGLEGGAAAPPIVRTERWTGPRNFRVPCPGGDGEQKPQAFISWLCADSADAEETMALACLAEILLGHDGSPLTRALVESGLGEDLSPSTGLEGELRETLFCAGLRGIQGEGEESYRRMETLIMEELNRLVKEGIPWEEVEAALLSIEFSHREIKRSHGPYSLVWLRRSLRGWLYGAKPWESLLLEERFSALKRRIAESALAARDPSGGYFESLIKTCLLENPHRALVAVEPQADYLPRRETALAARLREKEAVLDGVERKRLEQKAAELGAFQAREDSPEALKTIPHLFREDLKAEIEPVPTKIRDAAGIPCMAHPLFTNGISYGDLAFPVDVLEPEDYPWLPFFARAVVSMGLPGMDYGAVSSLLARTAGDFCALLETGSAAPSLAPERSAPARGALPRDGEHEPWTSFIARDWIIYRIKALDEKFPEALDLARRLITGADFSDLRRLRDLVMEMKNDGDASLAPSGHSYASGRSGRSFSRSRAVEELWNGISQIPFTHRLAAMDMGEVRDRMIRLREGLLRGGLVINVTAGENVLEGAVRAVEGFAPLGAPGPANPACVGAERFVSLLGRDGSSGDRAEVYASPSLQVGFAAMSLPAAPYGSPEQAAELVLAHELSTGALWESIRMMGGAYGAFAHPDNLEGVFSFSTYRDPDPLRSLAAFPEILVKRGSASVDGDTLEKTIIGAFARETRPQTPAGRGFSEFLRRLYGIRDSSRLAKLKYITALQDKDTRAAAGRLAAAAQAPGTGGIRGADAPARPEGAFPVIIAGKAAAAGAAKKLGVEVRELPV